MQDLKGRSELSKISADVAIRHYAASSKHRKGLMNEQQFSTSTIELAKKKGVKAGTLQELGEIFQAIDLDGTGTVTSTMWASGMAAICGDGEAAAQFALFNVLGSLENGTLKFKELIQFVVPVVMMMIPPNEEELRRKVAADIAQTIWCQTTKDKNGNLTSAAFSKWLGGNNFAISAMDSLQNVLMGRISDKAEFLEILPPAKGVYDEKSGDTSTDDRPTSPTSSRDSNFSVFLVHVLIFH